MKRGEATASKVRNEADGRIEPSALQRDAVNAVPCANGQKTKLAGLFQRAGKVAATGAIGFGNDEVGAV